MREDEGDLLECESVGALLTSADGTSLWIDVAYVSDNAICYHVRAKVPDIQHPSGHVREERNLRRALRNDLHEAIIKVLTNWSARATVQLGSIRHLGTE
jgi:hypothetical protein